MSKATSDISFNAEWHKDDFEKYAVARHGPDGAALLHPLLKSTLETCCKGKRVIDIACGTGEWSLQAARFNAFVTAVDLAPEMLERARSLVEVNHFAEHVLVEFADACALKNENQSYDVALSFNLGSMLSCESLKRHMVEMKRVLRPNGIALMNVPASLNNIFTSGAKDQSALQKEVNSILETIQEGVSSNEIKSKLAQLPDIYRASFVSRGNRVILVTPDLHVENGESIWRKIAGVVVQNVYHSEKEYLDTAAEAGFLLDELQRPSFSSMADLTSFNSEHSMHTLGLEYVGNSPYLLLSLRV